MELIDFGIQVGYLRNNDGYIEMNPDTKMTYREFIRDYDNIYGKTNIKRKR